MTLGSQSERVTLKGVGDRKGSHSSGTATIAVAEEGVPPTEAIRMFAEGKI